MTDMNKTGGADVLAVMEDDASAAKFRRCDLNGLEEATEALHRSWAARDAVAALIERKASLEADLARISQELGLPPKIGPAPGVIRALIAERDVLRASYDDANRRATAEQEGKVRALFERDALIERNAELEAERDALRKMWQQAEHDIKDRDAANEALAAEVKVLREDAERLDWLDAQNISKRMGWKVNVAPLGNVSVQSVIFLRSEPVAIREAIDAARASAATGGGNG